MTAVHDELTQVVTALSAEQARQVLAFARTLATPDVTAAEPEYEDWIEEDRRAARLHSFLRFAAEHGDEDWGVDYTAPHDGGEACTEPAT